MAKGDYSGWSHILLGAIYAIALVLGGLWLLVYVVKWMWRQSKAEDSTLYYEYRSLPVPRHLLGKGRPVLGCELQATTGDLRVFC
jgi:hypothetical protein